MNDTVDALIVGAGPAGLTAAAELAAHELSVYLIDEQIGPGGQIWRNNKPTHPWPGGTYFPASTVIDSTTQDPVTVTWLQRTSERRILRETKARALIIATGAMERSILFPGAQLPGVMSIGAVQSVLAQAGLIPRGPGVILAGHGPLLLLAVLQIRAQGASIDAVLDLSIPGTRRNAVKRLPSALISDPALLFHGAQLLHSFRKMGIQIWKNVTDLKASGEGYIEQVQFVSNGRQQTLPVRLLAVHDGVMPNTQLTRLLNLEHHWNTAQQSFAPLIQSSGLSSHPQVWITGDGMSTAGIDLAAQRGRLTALAVAKALGSSPVVVTKKQESTTVKRLERSIRVRLPARHFVDALYPPLPVEHLATDDTIVCRCEAITLGTIHRAIAQGAVGPNRVKTITRCGMGPCQGRQCSVPLTRIIATTTDRSVDNIGALRVRPPLKPALIADYLGVDIPNSPTPDVNA